MTIDHLYSSWQTSHYTKRNLPQLETQLPEVTVMDFGIAGTQEETKIKERINILNGLHQTDA
jgi:hypothetical protein